MTANISTLLEPPELNLALAWSWVALGFGSGLVLGLFFHREQWLGGYASLKRRLYRLGHISFFGLGVLNLCFYFTVRELALTGPFVTAGAWAFVAGAIFMPACCVLMAHAPRLRPLFAVPVVSLLVGGVLTAVTVALPQTPRNHQQTAATARD